ncbi:MAG: LysM peptidoglycan-binding domain-containing protein [Syntrophothermus sp.]
MIFISGLLALGNLTFGLGMPAAAAATYQVRPGDSLYLIARRYGVTVAELQKANGLWGDYLEAGRQLGIPVSGTPPASRSSGRSTYTVAPGDTLYLIAKRHGTTVEALRQANGIWSDYLEVGQDLVLPGSPSTPGAPSFPAAPPAGTSYTVAAGDTLFLLAQRYGTTVEALRQANSIQGDYLKVGQRLLIPGGKTGTGNNGQPKTSPPKAPAPAYPGLPAGISLSDSDIDLLARLVEAEAGAEPYEGKVAVAATVLNRLKDARFPKSVPGVVYQVIDGYYQYSPVLNGLINQPASTSSFKAVQDALAGWDPTFGANGFYNPDKTWDSWVRSNPVTTSIGNHVFFRS